MESQAIQSVVSALRGEADPVPSAQVGFIARCPQACVPAGAVSVDALRAFGGADSGAGEGASLGSGAYAEQVGGQHYLGMAIQPMQFSMANGLDACTHTAIKYLVRKKGDKAKRAEDLRKAIHCIRLLAEHEGIELGGTGQPGAVPYIGPDRLSKEASHG